METLTPHRRVANGIVALDAHFPDWDREGVIETDHIFQCDGDGGCVLAQVARAYGVARREGCSLHYSAMLQMGLTTAMPDENPGAMVQHFFGFGVDNDVAPIWRERILARRAMKLAAFEAKETMQNEFHIAKLVHAGILVLIFCCLSASAWAQTTLPDPRADFQFDYDTQFDMVYGPADALPGQPYVASITLKLAAVPPATGTRTINIPRAQITRVGTAPNFTALNILDVPMPIGSFTANASWVDGTGVVGVASNSVPFTAARQPPSAPVHFRLSAQRP